MTAMELDSAIAEVIDTEHALEEGRKKNFKLFEKVLGMIGVKLLGVEPKDCVKDKIEIHVYEGLDKVAEILGVSKLKVIDGYTELYRYRYEFDYDDAVFFELRNSREDDDETV